MELVHMSDFNTINFSDLTSDQAADMIRVAAQKPSARLEASKSSWATLIVGQRVAANLPSQALVLCS